MLLIRLRVNYYLTSWLSFNSQLCQIRNIDSTGCAGFTQLIYVRVVTNVGANATINPMPLISILVI